MQREYGDQRGGGSAGRIPNYSGSGKVITLHSSSVTRLQFVGEGSATGNVHIHESPENCKRKILWWCNLRYWFVWVGGTVWVFGSKSRYFFSFSAYKAVPYIEWKKDMTTPTRRVLGDVYIFSRLYILRTVRLSYPTLSFYLLFSQPHTPCTQIKYPER